MKSKQQKPEDFQQNKIDTVQLRRTGYIASAINLVTFSMMICFAMAESNPAYMASGLLALLGLGYSMGKVCDADDIENGRRQITFRPRQDQNHRKGHRGRSGFFEGPNR